MKKIRFKDVRIGQGFLLSPTIIQQDGKRYIKLRSFRSSENTKISTFTALDNGTIALYYTDYDDTLVLVEND